MWSIFGIFLIVGLTAFSNFLLNSISVEVLSEDQVNFCDNNNVSGNVFKVVSTFRLMAIVSLVTEHLKTSQN